MLSVCVHHGFPSRSNGAAPRNAKADLKRREGLVAVYGQWRFRAAVDVACQRLNYSCRTTPRFAHHDRHHDFAVRPVASSKPFPTRCFLLSALHFSSKPGLNACVANVAAAVGFFSQRVVRVDAESASHSKRFAALD